MWLRPALFFSAAVKLAVVCMVGYMLVSGAAGAQTSEKCVLPSSPPPDRSRVVFILDTSGSMQGLGDGQANIFGKVQNAIVKGMREMQAPGSVELLTFDRGPRERRSFVWPGQKDAFERSVKGLQADGSNTWLYASMNSMFSSLKSRDDTATTVYVITDGMNNDPRPDSTIYTALDSFNVSRGPFDRLYYIALATDVPQDVQRAFNDTTYAQFLRLALNQVPDFSSSSIAPGLVNVRNDGTFPFKRPANSRLELDSPDLGGAQVSIENAVGGGDRVRLKIDGHVPAGVVGYMCVHLPDGGKMQNVLLRFQEETPPRRQAPPVQQEKLGTLQLLNPQDHPVLKKGQTATWRYRAVGGPVTVELAGVPAALTATLPDQMVSLQTGQDMVLIVGNQGLADGQSAAPRLKLNGAALLDVPPVQGRVPKPFPWRWLLLLLIPIPFFLWWQRNKRPLNPYALSIDKTLRVSIHDPAGWKATRVMRQEVADVGQLFRLKHLQGLRLERFKPEIPDDQLVLLDNSDLNSIRRYTAQQMKRDVKLQAQPDLLRLQKDGLAAGQFLALQEVLVPGQLYLFTPIQAPPARVRPAPLPPEPPIEVIVTLLHGQRMQDMELPLEDVDLADVFGEEALRQLVVRREPGLLRLRQLHPGMTLTHISRTFTPGDALPLAVMLHLATTAGPFQVRIQDKASLSRYVR